MELSDLNNQLLALQNEFQLTSNSQQSQPANSTAKSTAKSKSIS